MVQAWAVSGGSKPANMDDEKIGINDREDIAARKITSKSGIWDGRTL